MLKFKNSGFKFWVECPTTYGNNFIVVRNVCKRRTWLTWVGHDPYEEKEETPVPSADHRWRERRLAQMQKKESSSSSDEDDNLPFGHSFKNKKIPPNVLFTQIRRVKILKELMPHQIYNHIDGIN